MYYSEYDEPALQSLAGQVIAETPGIGEAWIIFDNTAHGFATTNAARLRELIRD